MKQFSLKLEAISPLAIRSDHAAGGAESAAYISGTALTGSLANLYRRYHDTDNTTFELLFLSGLVQYPDLYPASFKSKTMQEATGLPVYPLPKTAQSCKRFPGFLPMEDEDVDDEPHGVRDSLLDWAMFELGSKTEKVSPAALLKSLEEQDNCQQCRKPMHHFDGFYRRLADGRMSKANPEMRLQTHTGINRTTGTVQENILYHRHVYEERTRFWGLLKLADDLAGPLTKFIEEVGTSGLLRIGTGRSRGLGKVHIAVQSIDEDEQDRFDRFKQRLKDFSNALHDRAKKTFKADKETLDLKPFYFALTLHSPLLLRDEWLRYRCTINEETLRELLGIPADLPAGSFQLLYQAASVRNVRGWNELWGMPRSSEYTIDTGSVFLFGTNIARADGLEQALFKLEEEGAGERRAEGFGRLCVSDPFHLKEKQQ